MKLDPTVAEYITLEWLTADWRLLRDDEIIRPGDHAWFIGPKKDPTSTAYGPPRIDARDGHVGWPVTQDAVNGSYDDWFGKTVEVVRATQSQNPTANVAVWRPRLQSGS